MKNFFSTLNIYLIRGFLKRFIYVILSISILIFIINLFDVANKVKDAQVITTSQILMMGLLQVPAFLSDISVFIIMVSVMITLFTLSSKSEITVMRSSGLSIWRILLPICVVNFIIGIIFILFFMPFTIFANKKYSALETNLIKKEQKDSFSPKNGIWLKQDNLENELELIIRADKLYKDNIRLSGVTIWFFDKNNSFYKKIDANDMYLIDDKWYVKAAILNEGEIINNDLGNITISTNLDPEFILQKIVNNFEDAKAFSIISLPKLIDNLESSGFSSRKFKVYFHSLLNYPLLFVCMTIISAFFSINNVRNRNNIVYILSGIIFGLMVYIGLNIINAFGSSGLIPAFMSTWLITIVFLSLSILLIIRKENF